ncbi:hypothetical protein B0O99DRAFT_683511 [Bisporella sp. PMI_857]|nr:hypothetical protein B0O99DRAFT_683511 [Bisporella sp. PMI_857]
MEVWCMDGLVQPEGFRQSKVAVGGSGSLFVSMPKHDAEDMACLADAGDAGERTDIYIICWGGCDQNRGLQKLQGIIQEPSTSACWPFTRRYSGDAAAISDSDGTSDTNFMYKSKSASETSLAAVKRPNLPASRFLLRTDTSPGHLAYKWRSDLESQLQNLADLVPLRKPPCRDSAALHVSADTPPHRERKVGREFQLPGMQG